MIVLDDLRSTGSERRFDWIYHDRSRSVRCEQARSRAGEKTSEKPGETLDLSGGSFVSLQSTGRTRGPVRAHFEGPRRKLDLRMAAADVETHIFTGTGPAGSVLDQVPLIVARRRGREAGFACVLEPLLPRGATDIASFTTRRQKGHWLVDLHSADSHLHIDWDGGQELALRWSSAPGK